LTDKIEREKVVIATRGKRKKGRKSMKDRFFKGSTPEIIINTLEK
jgi:hypothetical protein